uniref:Actin-related protein 6 n=2 Tax=Panagrellus redivivus TaxID=6233 RepID=A0A7E4ZXF7_PANRE
MSTTFILDNGSYLIKAGRLTDEKPKLIPNFVFKTGSDSYVGNEIDDCLDPGGIYLNSPFDRGYLVHLDIENEIWQHTFLREFGVDLSDTKLVLTDSNLAVPTIDIGVREVLFETYGLNSLLMTSAPSIIGRKQFVETGRPHGLVVDAGHAFTHIVPFLLGLPCLEQTMRIDVGGKYMTNMLRDKISYSQVDVKSEFRIVSEIKEDVCSFATDIRATLNKLRETKDVVKYYLPDFNLIRRGRFKTAGEPAEYADLTAITLGPERYVVPEILFHPDLINIDQVGLKEGIVKVCNGTFDYDLFGKYMLENVYVVGGSAALPGLKDRLIHDLSNVFAIGDAPSDFANCIQIPPNPVTEPWHAASYLLKYDSVFTDRFVSKKEYQESGARVCDTKFKQFAPMDWYDVPDPQWQDDFGKIVTVSSPSKTPSPAKRRVQPVVYAEEEVPKPPPEKVRRIEKPKTPEVPKPKPSRPKKDGTTPRPSKAAIVQQESGSTETTPAPKPKKRRPPQRTPKPSPIPQYPGGSVMRPQGPPPLPQSPRIVAPVRAQHIFVMNPNGQPSQGTAPGSSGSPGPSTMTYRPSGSGQSMMGPRQSFLPNPPPRRVFVRVANPGNAPPGNASRLPRPPGMQMQQVMGHGLPVMIPRRTTYRQVDGEKFIVSRVPVSSMTSQRPRTSVQMPMQRFVSRVLPPMSSASMVPSSSTAQPQQHQQPIAVVTLGDEDSDSAPKSNSSSPKPPLLSAVSPIRPPILRPQVPMPSGMVRQGPPRQLVYRRIVRPAGSRLPGPAPRPPSHTQAVYNRCRVEEEYDSPDSTPGTPTPQ